MLFNSHAINCKLLVSFPDSFVSCQLTTTPVNNFSSRRRFFKVKSEYCAAKSGILFNFSPGSDTEIKNIINRQYFSPKSHFRLRQEQLLFMKYIFNYFNYQTITAATAVICALTSLIKNRFILSPACNKSGRISL